MTRSLLCITLTLLCVVSESGQISAGCLDTATDKPLPVFINGIMNDKISAMESARQYNIALRKDLNDPSIKVALAYNTSRSFWSDTTEVTAQKIAEFSNQKEVAIRAAFLFDDYSLISGQEASNVTNSIKDARTKILSTVYQDANTANDTVEVTAQIYALSGSQKTPILLLPHSQGNLFANDVYIALTSTGKIPTNKIALFGVATPASSVAGVVTPTVSDYVTAEEDGVIVLSRLRYSPLLGYQPVLPSTIESLTLEQLNGLSVAGGDNHGLTDFYLNEDYAARAAITSGVGKKLATLAATIPGSYAIEVDWGNAANVSATTSDFNIPVKGVSTNTSSSSCFQLADLTGLGQYVTQVRNGSGQSVAVNISAAWPGGSSSWSRLVEPSMSFGTTLYPWPVATFQIMSQAVVQYGYEKYIFNVL